MVPQILETIRIRPQAFQRNETKLNVYFTLPQVLYYLSFSLPGFTYPVEDQRSTYNVIY